MKVRLIAISEETHYELSALKADTAEPIPLESTEKKYVLARLVGEYGGEVCVPAEMVRGYEIGDEFTLHLERVRK
jgi:hypothetical protein